MNRRQFFAATAAVAAPPSTSPDWDRVRADFPWLDEHLWISGADYHPLGVHSLRAVEKYYAYRTYGPGEGRTPYSPEMQAATKKFFAGLIGAQPDEIAFVQNTTDAENIVVAGMDLAHARGNVVIDSLHYQASKFLYRMLEKQGGLQLRVVHHREQPYWSINPEDMEKAIDRDTKLVSLALVSNINGYLHDVGKTSEIAHARGAIVYADIIQGSGAIPIDVRAMGIDCAGCGAYKWLMGDMGFGFLYVRDDLQDRVIRRSRYGVRQFSSPNRAQADSRFNLLPGAVRYEAGSTFSYAGGIVAHAALQYIHSLGIPNIRAHAKPLTDRLQKEVPRLGYPAITPPGNPTPIVSFLTPDYEKTAKKLQRAFGETPIAMRRWEFTPQDGEVRIVQGMRISPSVYNTQQDLDRLLEALS
ncbi:MAG: aminotransferase class V-fold PLP-dependent enzyme [Bryobacteraceae bacterium]|nr:aminotransferase class V-fold PLP-dependent enzyme [Bryobacteraceae bacterium]